MNNLYTTTSSHSSPTTRSLLFLVFVLLHLQSVLLLDDVRWHCAFPFVTHDCCCSCFSFVLIPASQNAEQQDRQVKQFVAMMVATTAGAKRTNE